MKGKGKGMKGESKGYFGVMEGKGKNLGVKGQKGKGKGKTSGVMSGKGLLDVWQTVHTSGFVGDETSWPG